MSETILIVDSRRVRREKLAKIFFGSYSVNQKDFADELDPGTKIAFALVHRNNWSSRNGWPNFRSKLLALNIPFVVFSAGGNNDVLHLEKGDEYSIDVWRRYIDSGESNLEIFHRPNFPEELVTAYLLLIAKKSTHLQLSLLTKSQWVKASKQCIELGGVQTEDWGDASQWDGKRIEEVTKRIRDLGLLNIPCEANILRGQLKHSWLENEILCVAIDGVVSFWQRNGSNLASEHLKRLQNFARLENMMTEGFSPMQLVDKLSPFVDLSGQERIAIKGAVHAAYLESSRMVGLRVQLNEGTRGFEMALQELSRTWALPYHQGEGAVRAAWKDVYEKASVLISTLECLPKGVVLP